jgi:hypothetical protein
MCLHFRQPCRREDYSHGLIDSHVRADHQVVEASVCPVALVVAANVRRSRTVEFVERGFTLSGVREARLDPLEFFLPRAIREDVVTSLECAMHRAKGSFRGGFLHPEHPVALDII